MNFQKIILRLLICSALQVDASDIKFSVFVKDEQTGSPVPNVAVTANFVTGPTFWGGETSEKNYCKRTDEYGLCSFSGSSNLPRAYYMIDQLSGYYKPNTFSYKATGRDRSLLYDRCLPYNCVYTTVLQRVEHPIPLFVKNVRMGDRFLEGEPKKFEIGESRTNSVLKFDFIAGDWLPPFGKGEVADLQIATVWYVAESEAGQHRTFLPYEVLNTVFTLGEGNGLIAEYPNSTDGIKIRSVPVNGYSSSFEYRIGRRAKKDGANVFPEFYTDIDENRCYCFRIRSKYDEDGRLVSAYYGKIYGDFRFRCGLDAGMWQIRFTYYLNPKSLDRNLEWDMKNNLCPDPGSLRILQP